MFIVEYVLMKVDKIGPYIFDLWFSFPKSQGVKI